ncbi:MAG: helix-turn-helix transcriptional regulator [Sulfuritalea sp.]|nr:helix-turn-helix transcriptional regulator [Sulfuritalea sp.]
MSIRALARAAGLTDTAVRSTETGASMPSIATVEAFAIALGVSTGWLASTDSGRWSYQAATCGGVASAKPRLSARRSGSLQRPRAACSGDKPGDSTVHDHMKVGPKRRQGPAWLP